MVPISSPLTTPLGDAEETNKKGAVVKRLKVQAIKKDIKQVNKSLVVVVSLQGSKYPKMFDQGHVCSSVTAMSKYAVS